MSMLSRSKPSCRFQNLADLYSSAILSWLIGFNIVNRSNQLVWNIYDALNRITEPLYGPIRRLLPRTGAFDFAPLIVLFGIMFIQIVVLPNLAKLVV